MKCTVHILQQKDPDDLTVTLDGYVFSEQCTATVVGGIVRKPACTFSKTL